MSEPDTPPVEQGDDEANVTEPDPLADERLELATTPDPEPEPDDG